MPVFPRDKSLSSEGQERNFISPKGKACFLAKKGRGGEKKTVRGGFQAARFGKGALIFRGKEVPGDWVTSATDGHSPGK